MTWRQLSFVLIIGLAVCGRACPAAAQVPIPGLYSSGVDDAGEPIPIGELEQHYAMTGPSEPALAISRHPSWAPPPAGSAWIGPSNGDQSDPVGTYVYELHFDLAGLDPSTASMSGQYTSDNNCTIRLNGNATGHALGDRAYGSLFNFQLTTGFTSGANVITFVVNNIPGGGGNPSGLLVANLSGTASATVSIDAGSWAKTKSKYR